MLQHAGATKDTFTMKEVMFYLGQYIIQKQLYDQKQQHIVHCSQDALGRIHHRAPLNPKVRLRQTKGPRRQTQKAALHHQKGEEDEEGEGGAAAEAAMPEESGEEDDEEGGRKRMRSDSYSLTFDESLSCIREVTIFEAEDNDSFDEDTEITEADYWRCVKCDELNPPLPGKCLRCWTLRQDWLSEASLPQKPASSSSDGEENEGVDVPDGKRSKETPLLSQCFSDSSAPNSEDLLSSSQPSSSSQQNTPDSQPSSSSIDSQELLPSSPNTPSTPRPPAGVPELERSVSAEWRLPDSCLDPCLICQSRPKNGCIVHGRTGHLMSCYVCARKLKKRNKLCPCAGCPSSPSSSPTSAKTSQNNIQHLP
ncbi:hypothetical protein F7725_022062, partial [Dissostichus mawsoni]